MKINLRRHFASNNTGNVVRLFSAKRKWGKPLQNISIISCRKQQIKTLWCIVLNGSVHCMLDELLVSVTSLCALSSSGNKCLPLLLQFSIWYECQDHWKFFFLNNNNVMWRKNGEVSLSITCLGWHFLPSIFLTFTGRISWQCVLLLGPEPANATATLGREGGKLVFKVRCKEEHSQAFILNYTYEEIIQCYPHSLISFFTWKGVKKLNAVQSQP